MGAGTGMGSAGSGLTGSTGASGCIDGNQPATAIHGGHLRPREGVFPSKGSFFINATKQTACRRQRNSIPPRPCRKRPAESRHKPNKRHPHRGKSPQRQERKSLYGKPALLPKSAQPSCEISKKRLSSKGLETGVAIAVTPVLSLCSGFWVQNPMLAEAMDHEGSPLRSSTDPFSGLLQIIYILLFSRSILVTINAAGAKMTSSGSFCTSGMKSSRIAGVPAGAIISAKVHPLEP